MLCFQPVAIPAGRGRNFLGEITQPAVLPSRVYATYSRKRASRDRIGSANALVASEAGEVLERDAFLQTFLLRLDDGQMETVPFSRWTEFYRTPTYSVTGLRRAIEPTEIQPG